MAQLNYIETEKLLPGLICHRGTNNWQILDENGYAVEFTGEIPKLPGLSENMLNPLQRGLDGPDLTKTIRIHQHDNDTGGFYVALFTHVAERTPEGVARSMILKRSLNREPEELQRQKRNKHALVPAPDDVITEICNIWGLDRSEFSWWKRGRRVNYVAKW